MLTIIIEEQEVFDEETNEFGTVESVVLHLEHSLISLSKWESFYQKPFLAPNDKKSSEEILAYIQAMIVDEGVDSNVIYRCSQENLVSIQEYIDSSQSATTFGMMPERRGPGEVITSELVYYWMTAFQIPFSCETWHINRLFSLIRICGIKNEKPQKMSRNEMAMRNRELNAQRRAELNTKG